VFPEHKDSEVVAGFYHITIHKVNWSGEKTKCIKFVLSRLTLLILFVHREVRLAEQPTTGSKFEIMGPFSSIVVGLGFLIHQNFSINNQFKIQAIYLLHGVEAGDQPKKIELMT
jgi:hypothetical protein